MAKPKVPFDARQLLTSRYFWDTAQIVYRTPKDAAKQLNISAKKLASYQAGGIPTPKDVSSAARLLGRLSKTRQQQFSHLNAWIPTLTPIQLKGLKTGAKRRPVAPKITAKLQRNRRTSFTQMLPSAISPKGKRKGR